MKSFKTKIAIACLGLASASFAVDEYLPIGPGAWELDAGYSLTKGTGSYDANGDKQDAVGDPMVHGIPLQIKYGVATGMDLELYLPVTSQNDDAGGKTGVDRPELALKYSNPNWKTWGLYLNLVLPVGLSDFSSNPTPGTAVGLGGVYADQFSEQFRLVGLASYQYSVPSGDDKNSDILTLFAKPEYVVNSQTGVYLGLKYNMYGESEAAGTGKGDDGYVVTVLPGLNFKQDDKISYEVNLPVTVMGKSQAAYWGIWASIYYSM
jgi:hypothetical protein